MESALGFIVALNAAGENVVVPPVHGYPFVWPDPRFPHRTEYDFGIQEGAEGCRGASTPRRR
ncbi:MAG TPA: hypothetical protein VL991_14990, partial [Terracidiphilus sp.]|nr:hypothetical protein [Terracidiphilus sp.]